MHEPRTTTPPAPNALTEAANLLRSAGYAVVTKAEAEFSSRWLDEAHERNRSTHDQVQQLLWAHGALLNRVSAELAPGRPRWLRDARSWFHNNRDLEPIVFGLPSAARAVAGGDDPEAPEATDG